MPRRANDPALLRAQAQNGRDGENAWRQATAALTQQRQSAVQQAMQEAALRGAPGAALGQIQNQVAQPYNRAIRNTTQMGAAFGTEMASRQDRMYDFNQAVLAARQLIPTQIQAALAPIRAQNRYNLQSIRQEGTNRIGELNAQTALELAKLRYQLAQDQANKKAPTLNEGDLQAAVSTGAMQLLDPAAADITGAVEQGQMRGYAQQILDIAQRHQAAEEAAASAGTLKQQLAAKLYGASYAAKAIAEQEGKFDPFAGTKTADEANRQDYGSPEDVMRLGVTVQNPGMEDMPRLPATLTPGGMSASFTPGPLPESPQTAADVLRAGIDAAVNRPPPPANPNQAILDRQLAAAGQLGEGLQQMRGQTAGWLASMPAKPSPLSEFGNLTEQQVQNLPDLARRLVVGGAQRGETFNTPEDVRQLLFGKPDVTYDKRTNQAIGDVSPYAADVKEMAMAMVADRLRQQGYDIPGAELSNAIMSTPESLYDLYAQRSGQPSSADLISQAETSGRTAEAEAKTRRETTEKRVKDVFFETYGVPMPTNAGNVKQVAAVTLGQGAEAFANLYNALVNLLAGDSTLDFDEAINQVIDDTAKKTGTTPPAAELAKLHRILKSMVSG